MIRSNFSKYLIFYFIVYFTWIPFLSAQTGGYSQPLGQRKSLANEGGDIQSFGSSSGENKKSENGKDNTLTESSIPAGGPGSTQSLYYNIHVLGQVSKPGIYKIVPSDRLSEVIRYAGGILPEASNRMIQLRRNGDTKIVDLFQYKYNGDINQNPFLMENDVIFVPLKKWEVEIEGPLKKPGTYELVGKTNLANVIDLAGGFSTGVSLHQPIHVVRYNDDEKKELIPIENTSSNLKNFVVKKGDVIVVPHILTADKEFDYDINRLPGDNIFYPSNDDNVYVIGAVSLPGPYSFQPHYNYKQYVNLAGPTHDAKMRSIKILHHNGKKVVASNKVIINPGDTIIIPQRYWKPETVAGWLSTLASLTISTILISDRFK